MFIFTERHDDGLLLRHRWCPVRGGQADGASGSSRLGIAGGIGAPETSLRPSRACHASVTTEAFATAPCDSDWHTKSRANNAGCNLFSSQHLPRQQALDELLNDLAEYAAASPAFRPYWRKLALHDIARFRRDFSVPEKLAFEAAVRASRSRRAA
jgi:hypothetical protein